MTAGSRAVTHAMVRLDIPTGMPFDEFRAAFEAAAPPFDRDAVLSITDNGGDWGDVQAAVSARAPHDLLIFATIDATGLLSPAGHTTKAVEYLLGNHVIAETMFRYHPDTLLYAPLRILIRSDEHDQAVFSLDQPSSAFASLGVDAIRAVGVTLDRKVARLLGSIGVEPPEALTASS